MFCLPNTSAVIRFNVRRACCAGGERTAGSVATDYRHTLLVEYKLNKYNLELTDDLSLDLE